MEAMGHRVIRIQEDKVPWSHVPAVAAGVDLFWWTCTWHEDLEGGFAALAALKARGITTVSHHLDLYVGLDREVFLDIDPFWHTDYVFTADGGHQEQFQARGINHHWIRPGVFGPECVNGTPRRMYAADVAFIGSYKHYHKEWPYRRQLIDFLRRRYGSRYRHFGGGSGPTVRGKALNDALASVKLVVGDSCNPGFALTNYWSDRIYETLGRGGFIVHPWIEGIENEFIDGKHLRLYRYGDLQGLARIIDESLADPAARERMRDEGQRFVQQNATYRHRLTEIFDHLQEREPNLSRVREQIRLQPGCDDPTVLDEVWREHVYELEAKDIDGGIVLDIGANIGAFTIWTATLDPACRVIAVEPDPQNFQTLTDNLHATDLSRRVKLVNGAAAAKSGTAYVIGAGSAAYLADQGTPVRALSLSALVGDHKIAVCKIDIEGSEYELIAGASLETLKQIAYIMIEFHNFEWCGRPTGDFGAMIAKLAEVYNLHIIGKPSVGGMVYGRQHETAN